MYHSCTSKTTSIIKTIKGARPLPTLRLEEGDCAPIFVQILHILLSPFRDGTSSIYLPLPIGFEKAIFPKRSFNSSKAI